MLHILTGNREKILRETDGLLEKLYKNDPGLNLTRFEEEVDIERLKDLAESQSLFGNTNVAVIDETEDSAEALQEIEAGLKDSQNIFILRRSEEVAVARTEFNIFAFTDAIGARNKRQAWVLYQKALATGMVAEELFYKVVWQVKSMILSTRTKSAEEAGLNPFVYKKALGFANNFKSGELENLSESLVVGYHQARRGGPEVETFLEKTILSL